jgi:hypothetical protein
MDLKGCQLLEYIFVYARIFLGIKQTKILDSGFWLQAFSSRIIPVHVCMFECGNIMPQGYARMCYLSHHRRVREKVAT